MQLAGDTLWCMHSIMRPRHALVLQRRYRNTNLYGCFIGARTAEFRTKEYADLFAYLDSANGFMLHRWDEQKVIAFYAALHLEPREMEFFDYVSVEHQGWARQARRIDG